MIGSTGVGEAAALSPARKRWTLLAVVLGSGIVFLDTSVVTLALPRIGEELSSDLFGTLEAQSYVANGYFVTLSALLILAGALSDYFGRRRMFAIGLVGFAATSLLCGIAPTMEFLILGRALQGAAGAVLVPGSLAIITATFRGEEQGRAFGLWAGASAATTILGPFVGGVLVNTISWRMAFLINLPFLLIAYVATVRFVPESRDEQATGRFDWLGSLVVAVAVAGLAFGTIRGQQHGWSEPIAVVSLAVGAVAAVAFPFLMTRRSDPLVPPRLFRSRNFTVTNLSTFVIYGALYVAFTFIGIFLIGTLGYNEQAAGIALVPSSLFLVLFSSRFGKLAARFGPRLFMSLGPAIMALGLLLLAQIPADSQGWVLGGGRSASIVPPADYFTDLLPGLVVFGIGLCIMVAPLTTALMTSVPARNSGVASAINNAISRVGSPLVNALIFVAVAASFYASIGERVPGVDTGSREVRNAVSPLNRPSEDVSPEIRAAAQQASTEAFHLAMLVAAGLMAAGAAVNGFGIRNPAPSARHLGPGAEQPPPESGSGTPSGPVQIAAEEFKKNQPQADRTGPARPD
ncbi:MAG TPA: MFS transporter [Jiangellaceae bacterium]|nr:MFS transporter [Jiangellaceae bacterium]